MSVGELELNPSSLLSLVTLGKFTQLQKPQDLMKQ